ncbi:MAG: DUF1553 domain-containing protein [Planctomycetaceae bacterium]|nr:DUF1553 domain-containing protein [Planctomycetaceae bacterium]
MARTITVVVTWGAVTGGGLCAADGPRKLNFNQDIRPILSNNCFQCHGPDEAERQGGGVHGLRLDHATGAQEDLGGYRAVVPGDPAASLLIQRITSQDPEALMPPPDSGKSLTPAEIEKLTEWVRQGGEYARHWSYEPPVRPEAPNASRAEWNRHAVDRFLWSRLEREGLTPQPEADRFTLIRRLALDLTGLPPTVAEVDEFVRDASPDAYEQLVDRLLKKPTYGEHWARLWLDLARYADSAGYADDPSRTIWAYRDYVIRAFQRNTPFDQFTIEQLAGDLLPEAGEDQLIATAFHRNTLTNNEGGTNDEEFRNVAVVDRVNTTFAVWMGTTINCAQCHSHKFDPITQEEFFKVFAILNQSEDADRRDESPLHELWTPSQLEQKRTWQAEIAGLQQTLAASTPELAAAQREWEAGVPRQLEWHAPTAVEFQAASGAKAQSLDDQSLRIETTAKTDSYSVTLGVDRPRAVSALRLEVLPDPSLPGQGPGRAGGNFVLSRVSATLQPAADPRLAGRFVRIGIPGSQKILSLAEVQVYSGEANVALQGQAEQSTTDYDGPAKLANDGNTDGRYFEAKSTTHSAVSDNPWWEVDLKTLQPIDRIVIWNRTDGDVGSRLNNFQLSILDADRRVVWQQMIVEPPKPQGEYAPSGIRGVTFAAAFADYSQPDFAAAFVTADPKDAAKKGWAIGGQTGRPHELILIPAAPIELGPESRLVVKLDQQSAFEDHVIGRFRLSWTENTDAARFAEIPASIIGVLQTPAAERTPAQAMQLEQHYRGIAPLLKEPRERLAVVSKQLNDIKPATTVPVMRDLAENQRRKTNIQLRGNWQNLGAEVAPGVPAAFHPYEGPSQPNRLELAKWLVDRRNPLTARVMVNRLWEQIFGIGIVATSEEFGSQGEPPMHPELLDWLAVEFMDSGWNWQHMLKLVVTSAAYKQSSVVTPEIQQRDPENRLLARGPRFRMSAEMIRDQALSVSGLLSPKQFGPPVRPLQPKMGVNAAFGSAVDWQTSDGEDRHRRALYTTWRRSNPYPSMATFDAPNREVCALRRERTNTPLQALVTLNDPVYIECAQSLARQMLTASADSAERIRFAMRQALGRPAKPIEIDRLLSLHDHAREKLATAPEQARKLATVPLGAAPEGTDVIDLAAWTVVANAILNLDEMFMRR